MRSNILVGLLKLAGKFCFVMAVLSFLGILDYIAGAEKSSEALAESMLGRCFSGCRIGKLSFGLAQACCSA